MSDDLVIWLRAQIDDDERKVQAMEREAMRVQTAPIFQGHPPGWLAGVDIFVSPTRWQAEVDAKRRQLVWLADAELHDGTTWSFDGDGLLKLLALPYAGREGYREEWRP